MKRRVLALVFSFILTMSIFGCGKESQNQINTSTEEIIQSTISNEESHDSEIEKTETIVDNSNAIHDNTSTEDKHSVKANDELKTSDITKATEEDARQKAEDEAKTKAEAEARQKAEEEAKLKAEEERLKAEEEAKKKAEEDRIRAEQLNSFSMMYYLAITAEEIRTSKNNRLILDDIYTSLLNDINPGAIDEITQDHLTSLRDIIKAYRNITVKRDRLQYIYNQDKAAAMRQAVPNPLAILSMANSLDWKRLAISTVYAVVDSYTKYKTASENADKAFLMSGWELDDEEIATVQKNRDRAFDYMVDMVQEYKLDGMKTLNEKAIEKFAEICSIESVPERISRLRSEEETYSLLGNYWLELADCYFLTDKYEKCLECVEKYNELSTGIYRKDHNYVQILPKAIVAAQNVYKGSKYISTIRDFADAIIKNTSTEEWSTRYFVSQVYLDLYARTKDQKYLKSAYKIAYENVTILLKGQRDLNNSYLSEVQEVVAEEPDYKYMSDKEKKEKEAEYKAEKKRVKAYNKAIKAARVTELPSLYEPLILNCELLFALADELNISEEEKMEIEAILKTSTCGTLITKPINDAFSFSGPSSKYTINFDKNGIEIPASLLTSGSIVTVTVTENGNNETFDDCFIQKVVRKGKTLDTFTAYYTSKTMKKHKWTPDSRVLITITYADANDRTATFNYKVIEYEPRWVIGDKIVFGEA